MNSCAYPLLRVCCSQASPRGRIFILAGKNFLWPAPQGDQPHVGFPEASYEWAAERLVRAGLRVVVVEQARPTSATLIAHVFLKHDFGT